LIDNAEEVNGDVAELLSNGHDSMLTSASPVVNVVCPDVQITVVLLEWDVSQLAFAASRRRV
jgi:hypothetical protein